MSKKQPNNLDSIRKMLQAKGWTKPLPKLKSLDNYNKIQSRFFDEVIDFFKQPLPSEIQANLERIVALAALMPGEVILDVGAGTGALVPYFLRYKPKHIIACDLSAKMLAVLKKKFPSVETYQVDVRDLSLPKASVDIAFLNAVWPNIGDKLGALRNLSRIIKKGGRIVISHPEGKQFVNGLKKTLPFPLDTLPEESELKELFKKFNFILRLYVNEPRFYFALGVRS